MVAWRSRCRLSSRDATSACTNRDPGEESFCGAPRIRLSPKEVALLKGYPQDLDWFVGLAADFWPRFSAVTQDRCRSRKRISGLTWSNCVGACELTMWNKRGRI